jgi:hypothetical protein
MESTTKTGVSIVTQRLEPSVAMNVGDFRLLVEFLACLTTVLVERVYVLHVNGTMEWSFFIALVHLIFIYRGGVRAALKDLDESLQLFSPNGSPIYL